MVCTSRQDGKICILAVFAHGGTAVPQVTSCLSLGQLFAIGASLQHLTNKSAAHEQHIRRVHEYTDDTERLGFASVILGVVEVLGLVVGAILAIRTKCGRRAAAQINEEEDAVALRRIPHGASHEAIGAEQPANANAADTRDALLDMRGTALWIEKGVLCADLDHGKAGMDK